MTVAVIVAMVGYSVQVAIHWFRFRVLDKLQLLTLALILVLGGATLFFHNDTFFKWKPTVVYWLFAIVFLVNQLLKKEPLTKRLLGQSIQLPDAIWITLSWSWMVFFILLGIINLVVAYHYDTDIWVNFKLFGFLGITIAFIVLQAIYMSKYAIDTDKKSGSGEEDATLSKKDT